MIDNSNKKLGNLFRPESLEGVAYGRLGEPLIVQEPNYLRSSSLAVGSIVFVVLLSVFCPFRVVYSTFAVVDYSVGQLVLRAPRAGQLSYVHGSGVEVLKNEVVATYAESDEFPTPSPGVAYKNSLKDLEADRSASLKKIELTSIIKREIVNRSIQNLHSQLKESMESKSQYKALVTETSLALDRMMNAQQVVTKIDLVAMKERLANAKTRLGQINNDETSIRSALLDEKSKIKILQFEENKDRVDVERSYSEKLAVISERLTAHQFNIVSPFTGRIATLYKRSGDWVAEGDEVALLSNSSENAKYISLVAPIRDEYAAQVHPGQVVRAWVHGTENEQISIIGRVAEVFQRTNTAYKKTLDNLPVPIGAYMARIEFGDKDSNNISDFKHFEPGMQIQVEITFGFRSAYKSFVNKSIRN